MALLETRFPSKAGMTLAKIKRRVLIKVRSQIDDLYVLAEPLETPDRRLGLKRSQDFSAAS